MKLIVFCFLFIGHAYRACNLVRSFYVSLLVGIINGADFLNVFREIPNGLNGKLMFCKVEIQLKMSLTGHAGKQFLYMSEGISKNDLFLNLIEVSLVDSICNWSLQTLI